MKTLKKIIIIGLFSLFIIAIASKVNAASANLTASKTSMEVGETATIKVTVKAASWNVKVSGPATINEADSSSDGENTTKTFTTSFKPSKAGSYKFTLSGDITDGDTMNTQSVSGNLTIKVTEEEDDDSDDNSSSSTSKKENKVSSDATLRNLGITPKDFSGFRKAKTSYNVTVPNSTEKINIYAKATDSKATVTGTGTKTLKVGSNSFSVKVTAADKKTTKIYTLNITRKSEEKKEETKQDEEEKQEEEIKMALGIYKLSLTGISDDNKTEEIDLNKEFERGTFEYSCDVSENVKKITVNAEAYDYNDSLKITGNENELKEGENIITVSVSDDKDTVKYIIKVNKGKNEVEENTQVQLQPQEKELNNKKDNRNKKVIIVGILLVLVIIVGLILFYVKKSRAKNKDIE